nr:reverse transcriptase domain-containing protein [Tanacetum cinerariifolium]
MSLTFADTHNMVAYLNKSDATEGFDQIIDFLSGIYIKYALTINPHIYVSCIKQFWNTVVVKQSNDVTRLQALVDKKKVLITEATIRDALRLDDAEGVYCLPNEEIFAELARMGYEKPSTKLTFYKAFFSSQWKFLIHTILQSLSAKRTSWNEFSSAMASAVICLSMFIQLIIHNQLGDLSTHTTTYTSPALTQKVFANMRRVGKGFLGVKTPLFEGMVVAEEIQEQGDAEDQVQDDIDDAAAQGADTAVEGDDVHEPSIPSPTPPPQQSQDLPSTSQVQHTPPPSPLPQSQPPPQAQPQAADFPMSLLQEALDACAMGAGDDQVKGRQAEIYKIDMDHASKVLKVVTVASTTTAAAEPQVPAATITAAPVRVVAASTRRRKGVVIRDPEEESTTIIPADTKSKDKGKGIMVEEPKPMKKKQQVKMDEEYARKLHEELNKDINWDVAIDHVKQKDKEDPYVQRYQVMKKRPQTEAQAQRNMIMYLKNVTGFRLEYFNGMSYDDIRPIFEATFNSNIEFLLKSKEQIKEEDNRAIQSINETPAQKAAKRRKVKDLLSKDLTVAKLVEAKIMREVHYHDWLSNPVMVKKRDGSWRMCVDFTDLIKSCPKDCYPLLEIDWKVESLCGYLSSASWMLTKGTTKYRWRKRMKKKRLSIPTKESSAT